MFQTTTRFSLVSRRAALVWQKQPDDWVHQMPQLVRQTMGKSSLRGATGKLSTAFDCLRNGQECIEEIQVSTLCKRAGGHGNARQEANIAT